MTKEILLNIMYTGTYLEGTNIGHEIINLFKDDNGNNYIYVLPYGSMSKIHNDKIETILLVRRCNSKIIEILAKATGLKQIPYFDKPYVGDERKRQHQLQVNYIDKNKITYNGLKPYKIFENNDGNIACLYVTFKAEEVRKVVKPIYITTDSSNKNCYFMEDIEHFPSQSPKMYISEDKKGYKILEEIINDDSNWENKNNTPKVKEILKNKDFQKEDKSNFIEIIKQEYDELTYSNFFAYVFGSNIPAFYKFAKEILGIDDFNGALTIEREKANIDLLLTDNKNAIVIENKIKSSINGVCERHDIGSELIQSQLKKYKDYVEKYYLDKNKYYFIFAPNYNHIKLENYECGKNYKLIEFREIYNFFEQNQKLYKNIQYFPEFLFALKKHIKSADSSHEENMYKRFCNTIEEIKSNQRCKMNINDANINLIAKCKQLPFIKTIEDCREFYEKFYKMEIYHFITKNKNNKCFEEKDIETLNLDEVLLSLFMIHREHRWCDYSSDRTYEFYLNNKTFERLCNRLQNFLD